MDTKTTFAFLLLCYYYHYSIFNIRNSLANNVVSGGESNQNKDDILVPVVNTKSVSVIKDIHSHHPNINEQAILLHEFHNYLPHKIIIEEDEEGDDEIETPVTIIKKKESYIHSPERVRIVHPSLELLPSSTPNGHHINNNNNNNNNAGSPILVHLVAPNIRRKYDSSIPDLLAVLAPLAAIPLIGSLAVSSFTTMLTLTGLGKRRRKRDLALHDKVLNFLSSSTQTFDDQTNGQKNYSNYDNSHPYHVDYHFGNISVNNNQTMVPISELFQLDIVQQYLRQSGRPDHNDEIIASYLACRGMFANGNKCLERLACHYADIRNGRLRPLERDVAALIIYSLLRNSHIDSSFKRRIQRAALFGYDHDTSSESSSSSNGEPSFVPVCDREFPCPKNKVP